MEITPQTLSFSPDGLAQMTDLKGLRQLVMTQRDQLSKRDEVLAQRDGWVRTPKPQTKNASDLKSAGISIFPRQFRHNSKPKQIKTQHNQPQMRQ